MEIIPTSGWGLTYMVVLLSTMTPCLYFRDKRLPAILLIVLWLVTRFSLMPGSMGFAYQATAFFYTLAAVGIMYAAAFSLQSVLIAICLLVVSLAGLLASWGILTLDTASSIYELFGLFAMIFTIGPKDHGYLRHVFNFIAKSRASISSPRFRNNRAATPNEKRD